MYNKFFGFNDKPFKLVPDPEYLFLSRSHEEALAHLAYAIAHGEGFVEITGEVGTGKTTLCRVFLENLDPAVEAAYIFNPKLDALQLLKAINDEFNIDSGPDNTKDLIDILNRFLIEKKAAGRIALVLIDEAQNLSLEVLEQLRLLSNLETTREKLLQIILVGQPELGDMLSSHKLRQLGQRITINCRLSPLTFQETKEYIRHRISLASHRAGPPFDKSAYRAIYEYSAGIPRLINIASDRILLNAFSRNSFRITGPIAREAIRELKRGRSGNPQGGLRYRSALVMLSAVLVPLILAMLYFYNGQNKNVPAAARQDALTQAGQTDILPPPAPAGGETGGAEPVLPGTDRPDHPAENMALSGQEPPVEAPVHAAETADSGETLEKSGQVDQETSQQTVLPEGAAEETAFLNYLRSLNSRQSRNSAMMAVLSLWLPPGEITQMKTLLNTDGVFFEETAEQYGLRAQPVATESDLSLIQAFNLPTIFTFYLPGHTWPIYLAVPHIADDIIYYHDPVQDRTAVADRKIFLRYWSGEAYISWKNFHGLAGVISGRSREADVLALQELLREIGYDQVELTGEYDGETLRVIRDIQKKYGLHVDGLVGPFTKIALYNESDAFAKPSFEKTAAAITENRR